jgi:hypothetical protein
MACCPSAWPLDDSFRFLDGGGGGDDDAVSVGSPWLSGCVSSRGRLLESEDVDIDDWRRLRDVVVGVGVGVALTLSSGPSGMMTAEDIMVAVSRRVVSRRGKKVGFVQSIENLYPLDWIDKSPSALLASVKLISVKTPSTCLWTSEAEMPNTNIQPQYQIQDAEKKPTARKADKH